MITVVTLNPCIDKTLVLNALVPGATNRVSSVRTDIGGKGINVSVVLKNIGAASTNLMFDYTGGNMSAADFLANKGIDLVAVPVDGVLRTNLKIYDRHTDTMTEVNEPGAQIGSDGLNKLMSEFDEVLESTSVLVLCGSIPCGIENNIYRSLAQKAKGKSIRTILDASGSAFVLGVEALPTLVKPNIQELSEYTGCNIEAESDIISAAGKLLDKGIEYVCVSAGEKGAYLCTNAGVYYTAGTKIPVGGLQGAGDSMVAVFARSLDESLQPAEMLRRAVAAAQATVMLSGTQLCRKADYDELYERIEVKLL